jgi:hypothetical protein
MTMHPDLLYAAHRYPAKLISHFRFPLSLRIVQKTLAALGISIAHDTIGLWGLGQKRQRLSVAPGADLLGPRHLNGGSSPVVGDRAVRLCRASTHRSYASILPC